MARGAPFGILGQTSALGGAVSATGRGAERQKDDFYETPAWCVRRYLEASVVRHGHWLEPGAGDGAIIRAVDAWRSEYPLPTLAWVAVEREATHFALVETGVSVLFADFLHPDVSAAKKFDMCIGNPPFKLAQEFIEKGLTCANVVAFLLRLNFLEGNKRSAFFKQYPCDVFVLPNRPSFRADGKTDACAYAWFEFGGGMGGGHLTMLATTPKAERLADRLKAA